MRRLVLAAVAAIGLAFATGRPAEAQARFGAQLTWGDDSDFGIGARLGFPFGGELKRKGLEGLAIFDYYFPDAGNYFEISANALYHFTQGSDVKPYVGGGVLLGRASGGSPGFDDTDFGLNAIGGLRFKAQERLLPFVEARLAIKDRAQFVIAAGVYFGKP